jgi:hypothetical protein
MRNIDTFLIIYAALAFSTVITLSLLNVDRIDIYVASFALEFFVTSALTSPSSQAESRRKTIMGLLLLAIFAAIVVERIVEILG